VSLVDQQLNQVLQDINETHQALLLFILRPGEDCDDVKARFRGPIEDSDILASAVAVTIVDDARANKTTGLYNRLMGHHWR
jgi:hypothetical protein